MAKTHIKLDPTKVQIQLKVTLLGSRPAIWRRLLVPATIKLPKLHTVLQFAFGWTNSHLHAFRVGRDSYQAVMPGGSMDFFGAGQEHDEKRFRLNDLLHAPKDKLIYEYDFGDSWEHEVVLEKIVPNPTSGTIACLGGALAGPPEDCGGIPGYYNLLEIISDPKHQEHQDMLDWLGDPIDAQAFDIDGLNRQLARLKA